MAVNVDVRGVPADLPSVTQAVVTLTSDRVLPHPLLELGDPRVNLQIMSALGLRPEEWDLSAATVSAAQGRLGGLSVYSFTVRYAKKGQPVVVPQIVGPPGIQGPQGRPGVGGPPGSAGLQGQPGVSNLAGDVTGPASSNQVRSLRGIPLSPTGPQLDDVLKYDGSQLYWGPGGGGGVAFAISSFGSVSSAMREVGESLASIAFTAAYTLAPDSATVVDDLTAVTDAVAGPFTSHTKTGPFVKSSTGQSVTFTLSATRGATTVTADSVFTWGSRVHYGASPSGTHNEAFIEALASSAVSTSYARTFAATAGAANHIYYCFPSAMGTPTFFVGGFEGGFELIATAVSVTNAHGVAQNYDVWRTVNVNLGSTTVTVA